VPNLDEDLLWVFVYRIAEVASVWAIFVVVVVLVAVVSRRSHRRPGPPSLRVIAPVSDDDGDSRTGNDLPPMVS